MILAICDDCYEDRRRLRKLIENYEKERHADIQVEEYCGGVQLCNDMDRLSEFAMIFMDINMDHVDGLQTVKKIKDIYPDLPIIIVTAFSDYALEGYRVEAARFLVKNDLEFTLQECLDEILKKLRRKKEKVSFPFVEGHIEIEVQKIIYVETNRHKNVFHTANSQYNLYRKLNEIEEKLAPYGFLRVHQSFLVNMRYVERISSYILKLTIGKEISVPKTRYKTVKKEYAMYKGAKI